MATKKKPGPDGAGEAAAFRASLEAAKNESTLQLLFKAARLLDERALELVSRSSGRRLRRSHTSLLPHIDLEGTRITDLAERLGVTKQAVSQLVDELEAIGVLAREADPDDARARRVVFTRLGREGLLEGLALLRDMEDELARSIGDESMAGLRRALIAILTTLEERARDASGGAQR